jgi:large subunit ribosomal protein L23
MKISNKLLMIVPRVSEKSVALAEKKVYTFDVPSDANKRDIKAGIESQYDVTVSAIRTINAKGKAKSSVRRRKQPVDGQRTNQKKAIVGLSKGTITILEENK